MPRTSTSSRPLTDHDEIRRWAEGRGAKPTCVRGTGDGGDVGMIRLDFPGYSGEGKLEEISWDDWFDKFDESGLALLVQEKTARGQKSNFNKLVSRETAGVSDEGESSGSRSNGRRNQSRGNQSRGSESRGDEEYELSAEDIDDETQGSGEDLEEETDFEETRSVRASGAGTGRNRKQQKVTTRASGREQTVGRGSSSSAQARKAGSQGTRGRSQKKSQDRASSSSRRSTAASRSSSSRSSSTRGSRSTAKKAPARAKSSNVRSSRSRSSSRKRAA